LGPSSGGTMYASTPILHDPVDGHEMYGYYWLVWSTHANKRGYGTPNFEKTSKNLKNSTYSPLAPSITLTRT